MTLTDKLSHAFTNGTLIDDEFCKEMLRVGNFFVAVSIEGAATGTSRRRLRPWT